MRFLEVFFALLKEYAILKTELRCHFENYKMKIRMEYDIFLKKLNEKPTQITK